LLRVNL